MAGATAAATESSASPTDAAAVAGAPAEWPAGVAPAQHLICWCSDYSQAEKRFNYKSLKNSQQSARIIEEALLKLGVAREDITVVGDFDRSAIYRGVEQLFARTKDKPRWYAFYPICHGHQKENQLCLVPKDIQHIADVYLINHFMECIPNGSKFACFYFACRTHVEGAFPGHFLLRGPKLVAQKLKGSLQRPNLPRGVPEGFFVFSSPPGAGPEDKTDFAEALTTSLQAWAHHPHTGELALLNELIMECWPEARVESQLRQTTAIEILPKRPVSLEESQRAAEEELLGHRRRRCRKFGYWRWTVLAIALLGAAVILAIKLASSLAPRDCVLSEWVNATDCSKSCGGGQHTQRRNLVRSQAHGGQCEPEQKRQRFVACNEQPCPGCELGNTEACFPAKAGCCDECDLECKGTVCEAVVELAPSRDNRCRFRDFNKRLGKGVLISWLGQVHGNLVRWTWSYEAEGLHWLYNRKRVVELSLYDPIKHMSVLWSTKHGNYGEEWKWERATLECLCDYSRYLNLTVPRCAAMPPTAEASMGEMLHWWL